MRKKIFAIFVLFSFLLTSGFGCNTSFLSSEVKNLMKPTTLEYWGVFNEADSISGLLEKYKSQHVNVTINYKKWRYDEYEQALLNAFAEDRGPDIFSIHNTWIRKYQTKITPMPNTYKMVYPVVQGTIKKEVVPQVRTQKSISLRDIKDKFIDTVYYDVVAKDEKGNQSVLGLPMSIDTLALYYNKDLFNNANIATPPKFWNRDFQKMVAKLTKQDMNGNIVQSGIALGGGQNIPRSMDILSVLMMQNGAIMADESNRVSFQTVPAYYKDQDYNPGQVAVEFYTDFANPLKEVYCWNSTLGNSLELFAQGRLAMMVGYSYQLEDLKALAPKLNFGLASLPQIENSEMSVNYANYWVETVSKKTKNPDVAWDFVQFATNAENVKDFLGKTKKTTALRELVDEQKDDKDIGVFAEQILSAKSWYRGKDPIAAEKIFWNLIDDVAASKDKISNLLNLAAQKVQQTMD